MKNILFILGAGSSADLEFPTGIGLNDLIITAVRQTNTDLHRVLFANHAQSELGRKMIDRLRYSMFPTIDELLSAYRDDAEFTEFGKRVIAGILISRENEDQLLMRSRSSWHVQLLNHLRRGNFKNIHQKVSFLTFNYERSLEHFLERTLSHSNISDEYIRRFLHRENFIHVHGQLGNLPWQGNLFERRYESNLTADAIATAAQGIKLPYEENPQIDAQILNAVERADLVCILGFGFHAANVRRAQLSSAIDRKEFFIALHNIPPSLAEQITKVYKPRAAVGRIDQCLTELFKRAQES